VNELDDGLDAPRRALLKAALEHIPWDGWTQSVLDQAVRDADIQHGLEKILFPKGAADLLHFYEGELDAEMLDVIRSADLDSLKIRERIIFAVRTRIELAGRHREAARRGVTLLALPQHLVLGMTVLAKTVDAMWHGIGDRSTDFNFYTKRATLAGVYSATVLYWLGDDSDGAQETWEFLARRIEDVMTIEKVKARTRAFMAGMPSPLAALSALRYPER